MRSDSTRAGISVGDRIDPQAGRTPRAAPGFYEFFAGGGMARAGLGEGWRCLFANDMDPRKALAYRLNYPVDEVLRVDDVRRIEAAGLPGRADLIWGSFPCQDLSLAGIGAGLSGERSGAFYPFWDIVTGLIAQGRGPRIIALENVLGALTSHGGRDFEALCASLADTGYRFGALVIDAALFVPQSRPRLFVVGVHPDVAVAPGRLASEPIAPFHTAGLQRAVGRLSGAAREGLVWWRLPAPPRRDTVLADLIEDSPSVAWHTEVERDRLISRMSAVNRIKLEAAGRAGRRMVGCVYRRTRQDERGGKVQRAEVRFDDLAGCLRTPAGGSSRQLIVVVEGERVRSRLISARETARLMGLDEGYALPGTYNEAYHLTGDGVAVPVVRHLAEHLFEPLLGLPPRGAAPEPRARP